MFKNLLVILLVLGAHAPNTAICSDYIMFTSLFNKNIAYKFNMNSSGTITLNETFEVGSDAFFVTPSPNGRSVLITAGSEPYISSFFINKNRDVENIIFCNEYGNWNAPAAFHTRRPWVFIGRYPVCRTYKISYNDNSLQSTENNVELPAYPPEIWFSEWSSHLIFSDVSQSFIQSVGVNNEGEFTSFTKQLSLKPAAANNDLAVSHNGKWAAVLGSSDPEMSVVGINKDGSLYLVEQWDFPGSEVTNPEMVRYTPDGNHLIMMNQGPHILLSFTVDQETGKLTENNWIWAPWTAPQAMAITPDSKFLVVMETEPAGTQTTLRVLTIDENGYLTNLEDKYLVIEGFPSDMEFVPPWQETPFPQNGFMLYGQEEVPQQ